MIQKCPTENESFSNFYPEVLMIYFSFHTTCNVRKHYHLFAENHFPLILPQKYETKTFRRYNVKQNSFHFLFPRTWENIVELIYKTTLVVSNLSSNIKANLGPSAHLYERIFFLRPCERIFLYRILEQKCDISLSVLFW